MDIRLSTKFTDKNLDEVVSKIYNNIKSNPKDNYLFDLTNVEYIGNQELLVLSALFRSFFEAKIQFKVHFFQSGVPSSELTTRVKRQIIQVWEVWKIWQIVPGNECRDYFGIDDNYVNTLKKEINYSPKESEIYTRYSVTPFITLNYINNYNEKDVQQLISPFYRLNFAIEELLEISNCNHPFTSDSLSTIITEELYLNFLDHSQESSFLNFQQMAFMSISFHAKLDEERYSVEYIQRIKKLNFQTECLEETRNFFYDKKQRKYKNQPFIEFSFLDFGKGIVDTLKEQFLQETECENTENLDSDILRYSFNHNSSRHPIYDEKNKVEQFIPRGLFDALTIVQRYKGLLIVRSNFGKIFFDFSIENEITKAFDYFGNNKLFFPGTLISLYIPAIEDTSKLDLTSIKPKIEFAKVKPENKKYINVNKIIRKLNVPKEKLYTNLLKELKNEIYSGEEHSLIFISFKGYEIEKRIIKKTIYFLLTDYEINHRNNVVILNSPPDNIIDDIATEIRGLSSALKNYKLHPLPIIDLSSDNKNLRVKWLGIYDDDDREKLNDLLYEDYSIAKSDFIDPANIIEHINAFDTYGNLISNFPSKHSIHEFYQKEDETLSSMLVEDLISKHRPINLSNDDNLLYLCSGNYYQKEYVELNNLLSDKKDCNTISELLYRKIVNKIGNLRDCKFIGVTTSSQKILKSMELQGLISDHEYISFDNYSSFETELKEEKFDSTKKYILVCDIISSGFLTQKLNERLIQLGTNIEYIAVTTSILDKDFNTTKAFLKDFEDKLLYLYEYPITKLTREILGDKIFKKNIIRINPHTNIPVRLSINETKFEESVIYHTQINYSEEQNEIVIQNEFLDSFSRDNIQVGFLEFNNVIHPYFFKTKEILKNLDEKILRIVFDKIDNDQFRTEKIKVFYPRKSGIDAFDFEKLKLVIGNYGIEEIEIERFGTSEGWKFPHNTDYLSAKIEKSFCFILDDGSCSGDSLIQMIDEISFYNAKEIVLLCIICRVNDHKREFFSRLSQIKVKDGKSIPISIYFVSHWHIPTYYLDDNPNVKEITWLNDIIKIHNTPQSIKKIARSIRKELKPKIEDEFKDHKYLPKTKDTNDIPKKELLIIREELGKVIGYRLYKESFVFFDYFIKKYNKESKSKNYYKEIELLCTTFIYEPYLFDKITGVLPDVVEQIEKFVRLLIFSEEEIYTNLTYEWKKKDIIHLFFVVFTNEKLIKELTIENFKKLIEFTKQVDSTTNYILYNLLKYFPLTTNQFKEKKFDNQIKELIGRLKDDESIANKEVRKYYNFICSLPSREDFNSQIRILFDNYNRQKDPEFHDDKITFAHNISLILARIRDCISNIEENINLQKENIDQIRETWFELLNFLNPILKFSSTFIEFLLPFTYYRLYNKVENGDTSLRGLVGFNEDVIFSLDERFNDIEKLKILERNILKIQLDFKVSSDFYSIINKPQSNLKDLIDRLIKGISALSMKKVITNNLYLIKHDFSINIPKIYSDDLILKELITNMKNHSKKGTEVKIEFSKTNNEINIKITNAQSKVKSNNSNGEGIKCLNLLSESDLFGFAYKKYYEDEWFIQELNFPVI